MPYVVGLAPKIFNTTYCTMPVFRYFTVAEANAALPKVEELFRAVEERRSAVTEIERKMMAGTKGGNSSLRSYMETKQDLNLAVTELYRSIEALESFGVSLKGIEAGMVDFPSKRFDEDVWLCWKSGETEIKFWHDMETGFMGRKPIQVSDESLV